MKSKFPNEKSKCALNTILVPPLTPRQVHWIAQQENDCILVWMNEHIAFVQPVYALVSIRWWLFHYSNAMSSIQRLHNTKEKHYCNYMSCVFVRKLVLCSLLATGIHSLRIWNESIFCTLGNCWNGFMFYSSSSCDLKVWFVEVSYLLLGVV